LILWLVPNHHDDIFFSILIFLQAIKPALRSRNDAVTLTDQLISEGIFLHVFIQKDLSRTAPHQRSWKLLLSGWWYLGILI